MVEFTPENALKLIISVSWIRDTKFCIVTEDFGTVFLPRKFAPLCSCIATISVVVDLRFFNRTGTTEGMRDFFLLRLRKALRVRANAALRFVSRNTCYEASFKIVLDTAVALIQ